MKRHTVRTIIIYGVLALSLVLIYPTIGWMTLSEEQRQERLERWNKEDRVFAQPNAWRDFWKAVRRWAEFDRSRVINLGLDLQGGIQMVLGLDLDAADPKLLQERRDAGMSDQDILREFQTIALRRIERRINEFQTREPLIQTYGVSQIQIQLPGEKDIERAKRLIMKTAYLTFHLVAQPEETERVFAAIEKKYPKQFLPYLRRSDRSGTYVVDVRYFDAVKQTVDDATREGVIPPDKMIAFSKRPKPWDEDQTYKVYLLDKEPLMTGDGLTQAAARQDTGSLQGYYHVLFRFNASAGRQFGEVTEKNLMRNLAIVVDGVVESAPQIRSRITTDGEITGSFSREEAVDLAIALNSGSMPVPIREEFTGIVGATLGTDSIRKGVISSILGIGLVSLFMAFYYRLAGVLANIGQVYNAILLLAIMAYFNATLTLPGIAGLVLTIGMAVDANVLIYECIREEVRNGRSLLASIENGFDRAQVTILDANITTLIAAAVLLQFGTGPIQGFAVTLSIGVCTTIFVSLVVTRALFEFLAHKKMLGNLSMASLIPVETRFPFLKYRRVCLLASAAVIVLGLLVAGARVGNGTMFGVDFTTGTNMVVSFPAEAKVDVSRVRAALTQSGFREPIVQDYVLEQQDGRSRFLVRVHNVDAGSNVGDKTADAEDLTVSGQLRAILAKQLLPDMGLDAVVIERLETVGPAVRAQLMRDGILAMLYAFVFMIVYLWFRFELKYGVGGIVALVHDVLITLGLFALLGRQITMPFVAALLTIIGYSINDTIVIFDRVRESLKLYRGRGLSFLEILDISVNNTLARTVITSITVLLVAVVLFFFGGDVLNDFALALIIGVVVGTYSSVFIASPVAYYWDVLHTRYIKKQSKESKESSRKRKAKRAQESVEEGAVS